jgi:hypothetical protein
MSVTFRNFLMLFTGVSLWVFFILINNTTVPNPLDPNDVTSDGFSAGVMSNTVCNFTLDGTHAGTFLHQVDTNVAWAVKYNATVFSISGLNNSLHEFIISNNQAVSYMIFDYAIYTYVFAIVAPSSCGSNVILGSMSPIILQPHQLRDPCSLPDLRRFQDLRPPPEQVAPQDLQTPIMFCHPVAK